MELKNWKNYSNYVIIAVCSILMTVFLPMLGTTVGLAWSIPNTTPGWIVWIVVKLCSGVLSVIILKSFLDQGKKNSLDNPNYIKALQLLNQYKVEEYAPVGPKKWHRNVFIKKRYYYVLYNCTVYNRNFLGSVDV